MLLLVASILLACSTPTPNSWEDCGSLGGADRLDCLSQQLPKVFCEDSARGEALVNEKVEDATVRDYIWYRVTSDVEPNNARWCMKIGDSAIKERCQSIVKRPHLQRGVTPLCPGREAASSGPGRPGGPVESPGVGSAPPPPLERGPPPAAGDLRAPPAAASPAPSGLPAAAPQ